jgi:hypothetical protein
MASDRKSRRQVAGTPAPRRAGSREESPLNWLARRKDRDGAPLVSEAQRRAGERLAADFHLAAMTPRTTAAFDRISGGGGRRSAPGAGIELADNILAARERVRRALAAVGAELAGILIDVCCHDQGIEEAERESSLPQRSGKVVLQLALTRLARYYGLLPPPADWLGPPRLRHWGGAGYRPEIEEA